MSGTIHGASHRAIKAFRKKPAALAVYWIYVSRTNKDNVAWPSLRGLASNTGWSVNAVSDARQWLVECGALERVEDYTRPEWRELAPPQKALRMNLDKSEYYRPTGIITINGKQYPLLYHGQSEPSTIEDSPDVSPRPTSKASNIAQGDTELDSSSSKRVSKKDTAPNGAGTSANGKKPSTPKRRVQNPKNKAEWMGRLEPVDTLVHALLGKFDEGYAKGLHATPAEYVTVAHLKKYVPVAEELHELGAQPDEVARVYAWAKAQYDAKGWTMGLSTVLEKYQTWKATTAAKPAAPNDMSDYLAWRQAEVEAQAKAQGGMNG